jgi:peroxiredoxin Q/BCP
MADWVQAGQQAPDFNLPSDQGEPIRLSDLRGEPVVLYFYPRDDTPGCTKEACAFRDRKSELADLGARVLGVSPDDVSSHDRFRTKYGLNFPLLADADHQVAEAYGAWREKNRAGKTSMGIQRSTFLIDPEGIVRKAWTDVRVDGHDEAVIAALKELKASSRA